VESAKRNKKEAMGGEAAAYKELQKIMEVDKGKAAGRAKHWVDYQRLLAQRKQLELIRDELKAERSETEDEAQVTRLTSMIEHVEDRIKDIVEPQRKARVGAFAPRYKMEGRVKGGWLRPRRRQWRRRGPSAEEARQLRQQRLDLVAGQERVETLMKIFGRLKQRASQEDASARAMVIAVIPILQPLTDLASKAVMRSDLPALGRLRDGSLPFRVDLTAVEWGGRHDIDLIALYLHQRTEFEQVYRLLSDWWVYAQAERLRIRRRGRGGERRPAAASSDSESEEQDPDLGTPFADHLRPIVQKFNTSEQTKEDYEIAIRALRTWLAGAAAMPVLSERQRTRLSEVRDRLIAVYEGM
jgi:hypothetical protein